MAATVHHPLSATLQPLHLYSTPSDGRIAPSLTSLSKLSSQPVSTLDSAIPSPTSQSLKKRRASKIKLPAEIKRSVSTPHMRSLTAAESDALSPTDKKRNKLGYHRTSVACGHCRRRKIRCLPAAEDNQKCQNCIRLKKECHFHPVDQDAQHGPSKPGAPGAKAPPASNPSSPRTIGTASHDSIEDFNAYNVSSSSTTRPSFILSSDHEGSTASSTASGVLYQTPHSYPAAAPHTHYGEPTDEHYAPGYFPHQSNSDTRYEPASGEYWRGHEQEPAPGYGHGGKPVVGAYGQQQRIGSVPSLAYTTPESGHGWTAPARSMSFGNFEALQQQYTHGHPSAHVDRTAVQYSHPHAVTSTHAMAPAPVVATIPGAAMGGYGYPQQHSWSQAYRAPGSEGEHALPGPHYQQQAYYAEPDSLHQIREEQQAGQYAVPQNYYPNPTDPQTFA